MKIVLALIIAVLLSAIFNHFRVWFDDTDDSKPGERYGKRSGLVIYTDHRTGVQYLKAGWFGGITPRIDKDGKPITDAGESQ